MSTTIACPEALKTLANKSLIAELDALNRKETEATVALLLHLAEMERRELYLELGLSSLFAYCCRVLRYSEPAAARRAMSAKILLKYPHAAALLLKKEVTLTTLSLAANVLNDANAEEVLCAISGKSRQEVEGYLAGLRPRPAPREQIRPVFVPAQGEAAPKSPDLFPARAPASKAEASPPVPAYGGEGSAGGVNAGNRLHQQSGGAPGGSQKFELRFLVDSEMLAKLREAEALISRKTGKVVRLEEVFSAGVEAFLEKNSPKRRMLRREKRLTARRQPKEAQMAGAKKVSRHISRALQDLVWQRAHGKCQYISPEGVRCEATHDLEFHHVEAFARVGAAGTCAAHSPENLLLYCRRHNMFEAKREFGPEVVARAIEGRAGNAHLTGGAARQQTTK